MAFTPISNLPQTSSDNTERKEFVPIKPKKGTQVCQVGLLVDLGTHKKFPKFAEKDNKREQDENGLDKILVPKEGKDTEQKVAVYVDLLTQTHDYEGAIGVKNIRLPLHQNNYGVSAGINFSTVAPRKPNGDYIKGQPWLLAPASQWMKIAKAVAFDADKSVADVIFHAEYKNKDLNNINLLLGKPLLFNVEVKESVSGDKTYINTKLLTPSPMIEGMNVPEALITPISIEFTDTDLLDKRDDLSGACKLDLIRNADILKIVVATNYEGSEIQKAIQETKDEAELIKSAKDKEQKIIASDKKLQECLTELARRNGEADKPSFDMAEEDPTGDNEEDDSAPF